MLSRGDTKPTHIMSGSNLSWKLLQGILGSLVSQGLIEETELSASHDKRTNRTYHVTTKGDGVIRYFDHAMELI